MPLDKTYINAQQLLDDSWALGLQVLDSGWAPDLLVGVWRGGTPVAIAMHELLDYLGLRCDHLPIKTSLYTGLNETAQQVRVEGLQALLQRAAPGSRVLLVDDVFDSGRSLAQVVREIRAARGVESPELRIATPWFKPGNNETDIIPDYYLHETADWLVFPHELDGLAAAEILDNKPGIEALRERMEALRRRS